MRRWWIVLAVIMSLGLSYGMQVRAQAGEEAPGLLLAQINQARLRSGLAPLAWSPLLAQAAQTHAEDVVRTGRLDGVGSDGSTPVERIRATGYRAWNDGMAVSEHRWAGLGSLDDALRWFYEDAAAWPDLLGTYREIGIGYAEDEAGTRAVVITLGARPGVLPVFINDGATVTTSPVVALRLSNEEVVPLGEGNWMGRAIEVRVSNSLDFADASWQMWTPVLPWELADTTPGDYTVYVEFRDGARRTALAQATIRLVGADQVTVIPTPTLPPFINLTPQPTPTAGPTSGPTPARPTPRPTPRLTATPVPTWTPLPGELRGEPHPVDWPVWGVVILQALALLLGLALFLRRRG